VAVGHASLWTLQQLEVCGEGGILGETAGKWGEEDCGEVGALLWA